MQKKSPLLEVLTGEIDHRYIAGLLAIVAIILHFWVVILLLQPSDAEKKPIPMKIMEVALITETPPKKEAPAPPAPPKANPPKKVEPPKPLPKKKDIKPPIKKKEPVIHKDGDIAVPKAVTKEPVTPPPVLINPFAKTDAPISKPQAHSAAPSKPVAKPGNGDSNSKGVNSGIVELGCPKLKYPARAQSRHIEGWVKVEVLISTSGTVANATVVSAQPAGIFDDAALGTAKGCRFKPKLVNGVAVTQKGVKKISFTLN